jgi:NAD(P)-dependent dehydrogenase (short-subunit alcohol dehydrogenase family)
MTVDGIKQCFAVSHVGHALLFELLLPCLAEDFQIITVSSSFHDPAGKWGGGAKYTTGEDLAHPSTEVKTTPIHRYANSKLAVLLWTYALQRHRAETLDKKLTSVSFNPGTMPGTALAREYPPWAQWVFINLMPRIYRC